MRRSEVTLQVNVQSSGNEPALLVLSDAYYPGWQATVDGIDTPIYAANFLFRGVFVPPGEHQVTFVYRPQSWRRGLWISLAGLALLGASACRGVVQRRSSSVWR